MTNATFQNNRKCFRNYKGMHYDVFHGLFIGKSSIIQFSLLSERMLYIIPWENCQQYYRSKLSHIQQKVKYFSIKRQKLNIA